MTRACRHSFGMLYEEEQFLNSSNIHYLQTNNNTEKKAGHDIYLPSNKSLKVRVCRTFFLNTLNFGRNTFNRWNFISNDLETIEEESSKTSNQPSKRKKTIVTDKIREWKLFTHVLKEENIAIHQPRKDECNVCCSQKLGIVDDNTFEKHIQMKNEARTAKREAEDSANLQKLVLTMDMQSVTLYVWHEANGGVTSNEFTSCFNHFLSNVDQNYQHITLISDGCNYQNRNKVLAPVLSDIAKRKGITIDQIYLKKGHTMMQADSVHSTLEHYFNPPINSPADYISRMRAARSKKPYNVILLDYTFFHNYEALSSILPLLKPGKKSRRPCCHR
ncbi:hypothetical protein RN001_004296 [Aquatica leii]|uniref:Uncharacterized protein n=1 Tax=Aquatica leii TaxID=1421715 RepID=A0AAN7PAH4_9COLE|nr:hypothetical protein RN001_004296 [Aquatica leii]